MIDSKCRQIDSLHCFMEEFGLWARDDLSTQTFGQQPTPDRPSIEVTRRMLTRNLIDAKLLLIVARAVRQGQQDAVAHKDPAQIDLLDSVIKEAGQRLGDDPEAEQSLRQLDNTSRVFTRVSQIGEVLSRLLEIALNGNE